MYQSEKIDILILTILQSSVMYQSDNFKDNCDASVITYDCSNLITNLLMFVLNLSKVTLQPAHFLCTSVGRYMYVVQRHCR